VSKKRRRRREHDGQHLYLLLGEQRLRPAQPVGASRPDRSLTAFSATILWSASSRKEGSSFVGDRSVSLAPTRVLDLDAFGSGTASLASTRPEVCDGIMGQANPRVARRDRKAV